MLNLPKDYIEEIKSLIGEENTKLYLDSLDAKVNSGIVINDKKVNDKILNEILNEYDYLEKYKYKYYTYKKNDEHSIGKSMYHHMGLVYAQEPSSYEVINNLDIKENFNFIDLCASPGGKSIDTILKQKNGFSILNEIDNKRVQALKSNIERLGFSNTIITNNKASDFVDLYNEYFDLVIVDAPCSGEGMFKKSETAIKNWSIDYVKYISSIQKEILDSAIKLVKPNGYLIYSTCTFSKYEDEENIDYIIKIENSFKIIKQNKIFPHNSDGEGQFYCILKKVSVLQTESYENSINRSNIKKEIPNLVSNILNKYFINDNVFNGSFIIDKNKDINKLYFLSDSLYDEYIRTNSLNIKYKGLLIGEIDKNGFIPSNELAHSDFIKSYKYKIEIDKDNVLKYLKGEVININECIKGLNKDFDFSIKEYVVLTYNNIGVGIGKLVDKCIKNIYPKGLRNL